MGNTAPTVALPTKLYGDGRASIIKVTASNVNPFLWQGPNPEVDGAGNRTGNVIVENLMFQGPGASVNTNSIALSFYGVQGITLRNTYAIGWYAAESYHNCDLVNRFNVWIQQNQYGIVTNATGYALTGGGQLNSFNSYGGQVGNHVSVGIQYIGGLSPCFYGVNFTLNATSLIFSPNNGAGSTVTTSPVISGCYFEGDTGTTIIFGGGNGIVRGGVINGCNFISAAATALITIANYSNALGRGLISNNTADTTFSGSSFITQATSAEKIDVNNLNGTPIGNITPSTGVFTTLSSGTITKTGIAASASVDIISVGSYGNYASISLTIASASTGKLTIKKYFATVIGDGNSAGTAISTPVTDTYAGGASPFTLSETTNSPVAGTNKLTITNNDTVASNYTITYTVEVLTGTLTLL